MSSLVGGISDGMGKNCSQDTPSTRSTTGTRRSSVACERPTAACGNAEAGATEGSEHEPIGATTSQRPALTLEMARYKAMLAEAALSEAERTAFLEVLWDIIVSFVDLGFHIHPLQQVEASASREQADNSLD